MVVVRRMGGLGSLVTAGRGRGDRCRSNVNGVAACGRPQEEATEGLR